jgi:hypothetical protein
MAFGIDDAINTALKVLDKFVPDPAAKATFEKEFRADLLAWDQGQTKINEIEAQNPNLWASGWRPAIGWACAYSFVFNYSVAPTIAWIAAMFGSNVPMPTFNQAVLDTLLYGMLGLGGLRTIEKFKGISK